MSKFCLETLALNYARHSDTHGQLLFRLIRIADLLHLPYTYVELSTLASDALWTKQALAYEVAQR